MKKQTATKKVRLRYRLQPQELPDRTLPYPYFIDEQGGVGRQDFWQGDPARLLGFHNEPESGDIALMFGQFKADPQQAVGMYPVFADSEDNWTTQTNPIESVEVMG